MPTKDEIKKIFGICERLSGRGKVLIPGVKQPEESSEEQFDSALKEMVAAGLIKCIVTDGSETEYFPTQKLLELIQANLDKGVGPDFVIADILRELQKEN